MYPPRAELSWLCAKRAAPKGLLAAVDTTGQVPAQPNLSTDADIRLNPQASWPDTSRLLRGKEKACAPGVAGNPSFALWGPELAFFFSLSSLSLPGGGSPRISTSNPGTAGSRRGRNLYQGNPASKSWVVFIFYFYWAPISLPIARLPASTLRTAHHNSCCSSYLGYKQFSYIHTCR